MVGVLRHGASQAASVPRAPALMVMPKHAGAAVIVTITLDTIKTHLQFMETDGTVAQLTATRADNTGPHH